MTLLSSIAAAVAARNPQLAAQAALLPVLLDQFRSYPGGVEGLLTLFEKGGLGPQVVSWIGTGPNMSVEPEQLRAVLGEPLICQLSEQSGLDQTTLLSALAIMLPSLVDKATPDGRLNLDQVF